MILIIISGLFILGSSYIIIFASFYYLETLKEYVSYFSDFIPCLIINLFDDLIPLIINSLLSVCYSWNKDLLWTWLYVLSNYFMLLLILYEKLMNYNWF